MKKFLSIFLITLILFSLALPVTASEEAPTNYITNGNFEMGPGGQWGAVPGWTMNIPVGTMNLYIGNYYYDIGRDAFPSDTYIALRKESNPGGDEIYITQTIKDLPVGVYEFSAWLWAAQNTEYFIIRLDAGDDYAEIEALPGVRDYDSTEIAVKNGTLTITIAANNLDQTRFMDALADDLKLIKIKGEEAFVTPSPTPTPTEETTETPAASVADVPKTNQENDLVLPIFLFVAGALVVVVAVILIIRFKKKK